MTTSEREYDTRTPWPTDPAQRDMLLAEQQAKQNIYHELRLAHEAVERMGKIAEELVNVR